MERVVKHVYIVMRVPYVPAPNTHARIRHAQVLNAKPENVERESEIVAQSGRKGAVTISTNMAGRGTDILLGGNADYMVRFVGGYMRVFAHACIMCVHLYRMCSCVCVSSGRVARTVAHLHAPRTRPKPPPDPLTSHLPTTRRPA